MGSSYCWPLPQTDVTVWLLPTADISNWRFLANPALPNPAVTLLQLWRSSSVGCALQCHSTCQCFAEPIVFVPTLAFLLAIISYLFCRYLRVIGPLTTDPCLYVCAGRQPSADSAPDLGGGRRPDASHSGRNQPAGRLQELGNGQNMQLFSPLVIVMRFSCCDIAAQLTIS